MDTTLRDGEQTSGVSFSSSEKLTLAKLLLNELKVNRIEIASARVSEGEFNAVKNITKWAQNNLLLNRVEILTFVDNGISLNWMKKANAITQNLLTKGSLNHLKYQLKKDPIEHFKFDNKFFSRSALNYLLGLTFLKSQTKNFIPKRVLEIGGGFGTLGEILKFSNIKNFKYINVDLPPVSYISEQYLSNSYGSSKVSGYFETRNFKKIETTL